MAFSRDDAEDLPIKTTIPLTRLADMYRKSNTLLYAWLRDNCKGKFSFYPSYSDNQHVCFDREDDAIMFLLIWS